MEKKGSPICSLSVPAQIVAYCLNPSGVAVEMMIEVKHRPTSMLIFL